MRYIDLQLNGYAGVDFNSDDLDADGLHRACAQLDADGVGACLATIVTDGVGSMCRRLAALVSMRARDPDAARTIAGIHIEGPFLNEADGFRGAHPRDAIRPADVETTQRLLDAAGGLTRIVTLAPERDPQLRVTRMLAGQGIVVSAGHTDASIEQLAAAIDEGLSMCTHVGNGCPMQLHRHDNIVQRMLSLADRLWLTFIADGAHVPFAALGNYLRVTGLSRAIVVSDGISAAGLGPGRYTLGRWELDIGDDMVAWAPDRSHLVGSAATMAQSAANLERALHLPPEDVRRLTWDNPRTAIGLRV